MTALVPQSDITIDLEEDTLSEILTKAAAGKLRAEPESVAKTPRVIPVSPQQQAALQHVTDELRATELPNTRRALTEAEAEELIQLGASVKAAAKTLDVATQALKTAVFNHLDVRIEEDLEGDVELLVDEKTGHYLVNGELAVPETGFRFTREIRQSTPDVTTEMIEAMRDDDVIDHDEYLRATQRVRVINEEGLLKLLQERPDLITELVDYLEPVKTTAAFHIREVKKDG